MIEYKSQSNQMRNYNSATSDENVQFGYGENAEYEIGKLREMFHFLVVTERSNEHLWRELKENFRVFIESVQSKMGKHIHI